MKKKTIGVLGGMGPESTTIFYHELIIQCQKQYGAHHDKDYPKMFIYNLPIPDVVEVLETPKKTLQILVQAANKLKSLGAEFIVMPCNSTHYFYEDMRTRISIPFLNIAEETAKKVKSMKYNKVGLLSTETTIKYDIIKKHFDKKEIELVIPDKADQKKVTPIILNILAGKKLEKDKKILKSIIEKLKKKGAKAMVIGCTDILFILRPEDVDIEIFDTVAVLAEATINYSITN